MSFVQNLLTGNSPREPYHANWNVSEPELRQVVRNAKDLSRDYRPSKIFDTSPVVLKVRFPKQTDLEENVRIGDKLGAPETKLSELEIEDWEKPHQIVLQKRMGSSEPDADILADAAAYIDSAFNSGYAIDAGLDDFSYGDDNELLYLDITDNDSFVSPSPLAIEGCFNGLAISASIHTELDREEIDSILSENSDYFTDNIKKSEHHSEVYSHV